MSETLTGGRRAMVGIAGVFVITGILALIMAMAAPQFLSSFSANAAPIITGEESFVSSVIVGEHKASAGVGVDFN